MTKESEEDEERRAQQKAEVSTSLPPSNSERAAEQRASVDRLYGLMRQEIAERGGGEAFLKWLRTEPEPGEIDEDREQ